MLGHLNGVEIEELLAGQKIGRLGCHSLGRTYVVPIAYAYEDGAIVAHSTEGLKLRMMRENPHVCFEADAMDDISNWRSVVAWGRFEELHGAQADRAMAQLIARLAPLGASLASSALAQGSHSSIPGANAGSAHGGLSHRVDREDRPIRETLIKIGQTAPGKGHAHCIKDR